KKSKRKTGDTSEILMRLLESRLDNVIYRLGYTTSRHLARQIIRHGHFQVNGRLVNIPSYQVKDGELISLDPKSKELKIFKNLSKSLQKQTFPEWVSFDINTLEGKILSKPAVDDLKEAYNINLIIEYYSR
ncbi:MAG TPA: 30S ribosomal protein S4, partial [Patescibacteria group bacterium]